tara:strand:+ start:2885 stop:4060 length:1176 start_codon:yes stop_codon:yes gene_type:complete
MSEQIQPIEEVVEETVQETKAVEETPQEDASYKEVKEDGTIKLDLGKLKEFQNKNEKTDAKEEVRVQAQETQKPVTEQKEEIVEEVLQEVTDEPEQPVAEVTQEVTKEEITPQPEVKLPENIESLVKFMEDTGGTIEEYVRLNADYSDIDNNTLLKEYYKSTKSHLDTSEIDFLIDDNFSFDEDLDEQRDIRKKKLALKEEVAKAKKFLNGMKDEYYKEVKLGSKLSKDQQDAINFYNEYNQKQSAAGEVQQKQYKQFEQSTNNVFNENFKGFDFKVGDKKYRYNVKDAAATKDYQSDISNFVREFLDENDMMKDAAGYHKALFAGRNIDKIVSHFYEQGKADAIKNTAIKSKNIDMSPRTVKPVVDAGGIKVRVLGGEDSSRLKFKIRKK